MVAVPIHRRTVGAVKRADMLNYALHTAFWLVLAVFVAYFVMRLPGQ